LNRAVLYAGPQDYNLAAPEDGANNVAAMWDRQERQGKPEGESRFISRDKNKRR